MGNFVRICSEALTDLASGITSRYLYAGEICATGMGFPTAVVSDLFYVFDDETGGFVQRVIARGGAVEIVSPTIVECQGDEQVIGVVVDTTVSATALYGGTVGLDSTSSTFPDGCTANTYTYFVVNDETNVLMPTASATIATGVTSTFTITEEVVLEYFLTGGTMADIPLKIICLIEATCGSGVGCAQITLPAGGLFYSSSCTGTINASIGSSVNIGACDIAQSMQASQMAISDTLMLYAIQGDPDGDYQRVPTGTVTSENYSGGPPADNANISYNYPADPRNGQSINGTLTGVFMYSSV